MKQFIIVILFIVSATTLFGQTSFQYDVSKDMPLSDIITDISEDFNVQFAYPSNLPNKTIINSILIDQTSLKDFMVELLKDTNIDFQCTSDHKVLLRKRVHQEKSNKTFSFTGFITDFETKEILTHGAIYLEDMSKGAFADENGRFELTIAKSDLNKNIVISFLGYEEQIVSLNDFKKGHQFSLKPKLVVMDNVVISHVVPSLKSDLYDQSIELNKKSFGKNKATFLGGSDLLKFVQLLPGINADDDGSSDIKIRGSNADETMFLLDNMPIYNADHYYGVFSAIQTDYVDEVRLYKNVFPIKYSGKTAGLLKMDSGDFSHQFNGTINLNLLNASIALQSPISNKVSLNLGGRTSIGNVSKYNILKEPQNEFNFLEKNEGDDIEKYQQYEPDFKFYDVNAKLMTKPSENSSLNFSLFNSNDLYSSEYENEFTSENNNGQDLEFSEEYELEHKWNNLALGTSFNFQFNNTFSMTADVHYSRYAETGMLETSLEVEDDDDVMQHGEFSNSHLNEIQDYGLNIAFVKNKKSKTTFGFSANQYYTDYELFSEEEEIRDLDSEAYKLTGFVSKNFDWKKWNLEVGARNTFYQNRSFNNFYFSPQLLATYRINEHHALKFSIGRNHQFLREVNYENRLGQQITIYDLAAESTVGISDNFMVGYQLTKGDWLVDVEFFNKNINGVLELTNTNPGFEANQPGQQNMPNYQLFNGTGNSFGVDFLVNYRSKNYQSWIAYTLSKSTNKIENLFKNNPYPNQNDRRHQLKWMNNFKFKKFTFSVNTIFSSGKPYLAYRNLDEALERENFDPDKVYSNLPFYGRIDFGGSYNLRILKTDASIGFSIFNLTNRQNVKFNQQTYSIKKEGPNQGNFSAIIGSESELLNRTLDLNFILKF